MPGVTFPQVAGTAVDSPFPDVQIMVVDFINPKIDEFDDKLNDDLIAELKYGADQTINLFFISLAVGLFVIGVVVFILYKSLIRSRRQLTSVINVFPSKFIFENRNLKEFMLK